MKQVYNPGCALLLYRPELAEKVLDFLRAELGAIDLHTVCCRHDPKLPKDTRIVNTCAGCDRRFSSLYDGISTLSLWEILARSNRFPFPDHSGLTVSEHDACPVRAKPQVHEAIRTLLSKMNIRIVEAERNMSRSLCCGDDLYPSLPLDAVRERMRARADSMPCQDVCVYCVSCIKSMHIGGKTPRYILDLLFQLPTSAGVYDTVEWHRQLQAFIDSH